MRASLNLIKKFVDLEGVSIEEIVNKLTFSGLEVEEVCKVAEATNLVIGQIISCENHPDSDHLHILKVNLGEKYGVEQIVCGAKNARVGLKVIVARVGAELSRIGLTIKEGVIRGVKSNGMCCSLIELGVDKASLTTKQVEGIEELTEDAPVGEENVLEYLNLDDTILDINVLANRSDCLAIYSLAKEIGALLNRKVNIPTYSFDNELVSPIKVNSLTSSSKQFSIKLVEGIKVKESPSWLKSALLNSGIRSINNIVDIGNYIMILTGQPIHMYDMDKLTSNEFVVRDDVNETFISLDEQEIELVNGDLCVTNGGKTGCLAGIMGASYCAVSESTTRVAIESANFAGAVVRRTSIRTGLASDSSARFIKGINPYQDQEVLALGAHLLCELAEAKIVYQTVRFSTLPTENDPIECSYSYINSRLGEIFTKEEVNDVFSRLGIVINEVDDDKFIAIVPAHRIDLTCDATLSEEIFRFIGLSRIKPKLPNMVTTVGGLTPSQQNKKNIREHLISYGFHEILTYTLVSPTLNDKFVLLNNDETISLLNPMTIEHSLVRRSLISSMLETVSYNLSHQNKNLALFEVSDITTKKQSYQELCVCLNGEKYIQDTLRKEKYNFYDIKGVFTSIMNILGLDSKRYKIERLTDSIYFHPGRSAKVIVNKKVVAVFGELHPTVSKEYGQTYILDMNLSAFLEMKVSNKKMQAISKFPAVERDYAFVMKKEIDAESIVNLVKNQGRGMIEEVKIFDVYEGEFLPVGYKSLALKVKYSSLDHTLKDNDINPIEEKIISAINQKFGAYLRS